jgi:hypothetical protein
MQRAGWARVKAQQSRVRAWLEAPFGLGGSARGAAPLDLAFTRSVRATTSIVARVPMSAQVLELVLPRAD